MLCTVRLARRVLSREEAPSVRLAALARLFSAACQPTHRALDDARATVDVLHALIERVGNQGVHTYPPNLRAYLPNVTPTQRRKKVLAEGLPRRPGVYLFRGPSGEVLYVGTAVDLRRRVGQYFTGADTRGRMKEMVTLATAVEHVECAHALEAGVRELRMLAAHAPPYNRRSKFPQRWWWVGLSDEAFPRLSVLRAPRHDRVVGPFRTRADATETAALLARFTGLRTCTARLARSALHGPACPLLEVSPCPAARDVTATQYAAAAARAAALIDGLDNTALAAAVQQVSVLAERSQYESAARLRDRTATAVEALWRAQRLRALAALPELIAAAPDADGGYQLAVIRHGQLAAAGTATRGVPPMPVVDALQAGAQVVLPAPAPLGGALVEETALIARWLATPGVRIVRVSSENDAGWASPLQSAGAWTAWAALARSARLASQQDPAQDRGSDLLAVHNNTIPPTRKGHHVPRMPDELRPNRLLETGAAGARVSARTFGRRRRTVGRLGRLQTSRVAATAPRAASQLEPLEESAIKEWIVLAALAGPPAQATTSTQPHPTQRIKRDPQRARVLRVEIYEFSTRPCRTTTALRICL